MSSHFQKNIQDWVAIDNQIKTLNQEVKELRNVLLNHAKIINEDDISRCHNLCLNGSELISDQSNLITV